ncbi:MAG: RIP metalloprotease RseP [Chitinophagales bacterium]
MSIIVALIVLIVLIVIHEAGHFWAARSVGCDVYEFSLGFGPLIARWGGKKPEKGEDDTEEKRNSETQYSLRLFPIGGYVQIAGMEPGDDNPNGYNYKTPWQKIKISGAGPVMNFVLAVVLFITIYTFIGVAQKVPTPTVGQVVAGKPAAHAGLMAGDRILKIDGVKISTWDQMVQKLKKSPRGHELQLTVKRGKKTFTTSVMPEYDKSRKTNMLGITSDVKYKRQGLWQGIKYGFVDTYRITKELLKGFIMVITGQVSTRSLSGPVGIVKLIGDAAQGGLVYLLNLTAILSINLGIFNLIPFPALDGSRIIFAGIESVRGKPVEPEKENMIHLVGFVVLLSLIVLVTYNDIVNIFRGG